MAKSNILEQIPRWALVLLAGYGIFLLQQKFDLMDRSVQNHEKELQEIRIVLNKLTYIIEEREKDTHARR